MKRKSNFAVPTGWETSRNSLTENDSARRKPQHTLDPDKIIDLDHILDAVAPSIYGHRLAKKALLLMLVGGVSKKNAAGDWQSRGCLHVCLLGQSGTAKSSLLKWMATASPQAVSVSASSASSAGLTVGLADGGQTLSPGALLQASGGVCCIDEFDRASAEVKHAIAEVMDHQSITVAKAGVHTKFKAETSVLIASLPKASRIDATQPVSSNMDMSQSISQCFDIVVMLREQEDVDDAAKMVSHILALTRGSGSAARGQISTHELRDYVRSARKIDPQITDAASEELQIFYRKMRERGKASPRNLESLIRVSEAIARVYLQHHVTAAHVEEAFEMVSADLSPAREDNEGYFSGLKHARRNGA